MEQRAERGRVLRRLAMSRFTASPIQTIITILSGGIMMAVIASTLNTNVSMVKTSQQVMHDRTGTMAEYRLENPAAAQIKQLRESGLVNGVGGVTRVGSAKSAGLVFEMVYADTEEWEKNRKPTVDEIAGDVPQGMRDIMISRQLLRKMGIERPFIGQEIKVAIQGIEYSGSEEITFNLSGWFIDYTDWHPESKHTVYISPPFADLMGQIQQLERTAYFKLKTNPVFSDFKVIKDIFWLPSMKRLDVQKEQQIIASLSIRLDLREDQTLTKIYTQPEYRFSVMGVSPEYIPIALCCLLFAILLLFDCFFLTVENEKTHCRLFRAVGMTGKQTRKVSFRYGCLIFTGSVLAGSILSIILTVFAIPLYIQTGMDAHLRISNSFSITALLLSMPVVLAIILAGSKYAAYLMNMSGREGVAHRNRGALIAEWAAIIAGPKFAARLMSRIGYENSLPQSSVESIAAQRPAHYENSLLQNSVEATVTQHLSQNEDSLLHHSYEAAAQHPTRNASTAQDALLRRHELTNRGTIKKSEKFFLQKRYYVISMALNIAFRSMKRNARPLLSLVSAAVIFLTVSITVTGINPEKADIRGHDFSLDNLTFIPHFLVLGKVYPHWIAQSQIDVFPDSFVAALQGNREISEVNIEKRLHTAVLINDMLLPCILVGGNTVYLKERMSDDQKARIDFDAFERGKIALIETYSPDQFQDYSVIEGFVTEEIISDYGLNPIFPGKESWERFSFETGGFIRPHTAEAERFPPAVYVHENALQTFKTAPIITRIVMDVPGGKAAEVDAWLHQLVGGYNEFIYIGSRIKEMNLLETRKRAAYAIGYSLAFLMCLIALCSLVVLASITVLQRKKEFGALWSVGMTDRQIKRMLMLEGICYATPVAVLTFAVCHFGVFRHYLSNHEFYEIFRYPLAEMIGVCVIIYLVSLFMPVFVYKRSKTGVDL